MYTYTSDISSCDFNVIKFKIGASLLLCHFTYANDVLGNIYIE